MEEDRGGGGGCSPGGAWRCPPVSAKTWLDTAGGVHDPLSLLLSEREGTCVTLIMRLKEEEEEKKVNKL